MDSSTDNGTPPPDEDGRNLVLSIDGTANEFSIQNTNVVELCRILIKDETQLTYYTSGIGTFADPHNTIFGKMKESFDTVLEMVTANHFERKIFAAYQWLSENYKPGDRIFLFGFSRGAYFVRVIAGMIKKVGLLHKGNNDQIPFAFKLYSCSQEEHVCPESPAKPVSSSGSPSKPATNSDHPPNSATDPNSPAEPVSKAEPPSSPATNSEPPTSPATDSDSPAGSWSDSKLTPDSKSTPDSNATQTDRLCARYKAAFSHDDVEIHFVGAWDTVSSVGFMRSACLPETIGMSHVKHFRHALALDEWRVKFVPEYAHRCDTKEERIKEVWFRGCHADM